MFTPSNWKFTQELCHLFIELLWKCVYYHEWNLLPLGYLNYHLLVSIHKFGYTFQCKISESLSFMYILSVRFDSQTIVWYNGVLIGYYGDGVSNSHNFDLWWWIGIRGVTIHLYMDVSHCWCSCYLYRIVAKYRDTSMSLLSSIILQIQHSYSAVCNIAI